jgi:hypothetical protein
MNGRHPPRPEEDQHVRQQAHKLVRGFSKNLLKVWPALWTFTEIVGVEPTNNRAERALRRPVIHRKLRSAASPTGVSARSSASCRPPSPAAYSAARCSPT